MGISVKPDGKIGEMAVRPYTLTSTDEDGVKTDVNLGSDDVVFIYRKPGETTWNEISAAESGFAITDAANGEVQIQPADSFWDINGVWRYYFQQQSTRVVNYPHSQDLEIFISDGAA